MSKRSRKKRFPREDPQPDIAEKPDHPDIAALHHQVEEEDPNERKPAHSADAVIGGEQVLEVDEQGKVHEVPEDNLQMEIIKKREWMSSHQFGLTPQEREKKWDEIRALEGKLRSRA